MTLIADWNISNPVTYQRMRQLLLEQGGGIQEGVVGANDLKVVQRGAGANQSVDVGTGADWVQIDTGTRNGLGHVYNDATANVVVTASNGTNPRIDQIILRWNDTSIPTGSGNVPTLEVLTGTATSGATLDNRTGAAALPNDCLRLADILVPAASSSVTTANIRDRRPWARGATRILTRTAGDIGPTAYAANTELSTADMRPRVECSGALIRLSWSITINPGVGVGRLMPMMDSALVIGAASSHFTATSNVEQTYHFSYTFAPAAGSHLFSLAIRTGASSATVRATADQPWQMMVEELIRPNADNT